MDQSILTPVLALVLWTLIVWIWMYATRIPAMRTHRIHPQEGKHAREMNSRLPSGVRAIGDNYNHLHEQPTIFYALVFYIHLAGITEPLYVWLAWAYVAVRILHSLIQNLWNNVTVRFFVFAAGSIVLMVMAGMAAVKAFS